MKTYYVMYLLLIFSEVNAQEARILTLEQCQTAAEQQYPLTQKRDLIAKTREYTLDNISKGYLPQFRVSGQATYQSDVTKIPLDIPGSDIPELDKDQYKLYAEMNQVIYDGGVIGLHKKSETARANVEMQSLEVELYKLKERINDLYFGIMMIDGQLKTNELFKEDIRIGLKSVEAQIANGTSFRSNADILNAELLKAGQQTVTLANNKNAYLQMLGLFIGIELDGNTVLSRPDAPTSGSSINRPELKRYSFQDESLELRKQMIGAENRPKLDFFIQAGYANPALNMFEEGFDGYYIGGVRMTWSFSYTSKKERQIIELDKLDNEAQKETFLFNTNQNLKQQSAEITRLQENLAIDGDIIKLRNNVKKASLAQLQNGVISTSDYLREVNEEHVALQNKSNHETELLLAQYREKTTKGN